jgi:hypothetical protein
LHLLPPRVTLWVIPVGDDFGASPTEPLGWGPQAVAGLESADSDVGRRGDHAWGLEQRCQAAATVIGRELSPAGNRPTTQTAAGPPERQNHA